MTVARIGVLGAGTMGSGIAQVAALGGYKTVTYEPDADVLEAGQERTGEGFGKSAERGGWSPEYADIAVENLSGTIDLADLAGCDLVIEAVPEILELKRELLASVAAICDPRTILATNTSSLRVAEIAKGVPDRERVVGMHFFNPPGLMKLVEVVATEESSEAALAATTEVAERMRRVPIRAPDTLGFVANRLARPFNLEALRMLSDGVASAATIDRTYRLGGGFRMGPFELIDLIGLDVNLTIARSFFTQGGEPERWRPNPIQEGMVKKGRLGRKSGRGFYEYDEAIERPLDPELGILAPTLDPEKLARIDPVAEGIISRLFAQIANETAFALADQIASSEDMDIAMRLGLNWPLGPFGFAEKIGSERALKTLERLETEHGPAYTPAPLLRVAAERGVPLRDLDRQRRAR